MVFVLCLSEYLLISLSTFPSKQIKTLVNLWLTGERDELSKGQPAASFHGRQVIGIFALLLVYSHGGYFPLANTQIHQMMKLHNNFSSNSFILYVYSGRVIDIIHNNLTLVCLCFLLLASKCDYLRDSGLMTWGRCM
jgi:hypothetical protein